MTNVFLIGFMGSGKTSVSKYLGRLLGKFVVDTDEQIELSENCLISDIFDKKGEDYFRTLEHQFLKEFDGENLVISTGGGMPCFNSNIEIMKDLGVVIYLKSSSEQLSNRLINDVTRPLLKKQDDLLEFIKDKLEEREENYSQADFILDTNDKSIEQISREIKELL